MKAIRKEVECIRYNGNPEEVHKAYTEFIDMDAILNVLPSFMMLRSNYYDPVTIDNGDWLVLSGFFESYARTYTDKKFNEQYEIYK